jgi:glycosyltransferase involved in cell wall biosynthesis
MTPPTPSFRRPRVLQLAYACSPDRGSEAGIGWHRAVQSAKHFDTWVLCEEHEFAGEIRRHLRVNGEIPGLNFVFVPMDGRQWAWGRVHDLIWYAVLRRWHRQAYRVARQLHEEIGFNLVHQVGFCGYREPGDLWRLPSPFVWGPIGGTQNYPWRFLPSAGLGGAFHETCRNVMNDFQLRASRRVRRAARKASLILAANSTVRADFARAHRIAPQVLIETGLADVPGTPRKRDAARDTIRILWSGLLVHRKALHLLIRALATLPPDIRYEVRILGEGPLRRPWGRLARRLGIDRHIAWLGPLPHKEALKQYHWADLFAFTSLRDTSGNVVLEALAAGVPVVCLDHQGMHDVVTDQCGVKIPVTTPREAIAGFAEAVARLASDSAEWERLSAGAVERARDFLWSRQEEFMANLYRQVLDRS